LSNPPNIISCNEARALGLMRYFTGKPCKRGHVAERDVNRGCVECMREWRAAHPEKIREYTRKYRAANPERARENWRRWYAANLERVRERERLRHARNKGRILSQKVAKQAANKIDKRRAAPRRAARAGSKLNRAGRPGELEGNFST